MNCQEKEQVFITCQKQVQLFLNGQQRCKNSSTVRSRCRYFSAVRKSAFTPWQAIGGSHMQSGKRGVGTHEHPEGGAHSHKRVEVGTKNIQQMVQGMISRQEAVQLSVLYRHAHLLTDNQVTWSHVLQLDKQLLIKRLKKDCARNEAEEGLANYL